MHGDFDTDSYPQAGNWILFIISSVLLPLIMLNMLIAIMSDTYARVMAEIVPSDFSELNDMILEQEEVLLWRRSLGKPEFLHFGEIMQQGEAGEWEGQIQGILKEMEARSGNSQELVKKQQEQQEAILNQLMIQQRDTLLKFDE